MNDFNHFVLLQNENITKLKIDNNPFAKGFRETGQSRCKRKYKTDDDKNCSFKSNPNTSSLDNLMQERRSESNVLDDDVCETVKRSTSITTDQESPSREENNHDEMSTRFHRPWLDSPSSNRPIAPSPLSRTVSPYHYRPFCVTPSFPQMFMQQPNLKLRYYYSMLCMNL